jgi:hypothetical protein
VKIGIPHIFPVFVARVRACQVQNLFSYSMIPAKKNPEISCCRCWQNNRAKEKKDAVAL